MKIRVLCLGLLVAGMTMTAQQPDYTRTIQKTSALINALVQRNAIKGLSIGLVDNQTLAWSAGFGYADVGFSIDADSMTIYEVGAIETTMTAAATLRAAEDGLVDIDQPLATYLPAFSINQRFPDSAPITPRAVMCHHAGIPGNLYVGAYTVTPNPLYPQQILEFLATSYTTAPVNQVYSYSGAGYVVLAQTLAAVSGQTFQAYMWEKLFSPMGMTSTTYDRDAAAATRRLARTYADGAKIPEFYINSLGAGALYSSVSDMSNYVKTLFNDGVSPSGVQVLTPESVAALFTRQNAGSALDADFGVGMEWELDDIQDLKYAGRIATQTGATVAARSSLFLSLDHEIGVIVISNTVTAGPALAAIAQTALQYAILDKDGIAPPDPPSPDVSPIDLNYPQSELEALAGVYPTPDGFDYFEANVDGLKMISYSGTDTIVRQLVPREDGLFTLEGDAGYLEFRLEFTQADGKNVVNQVFTDNSRFLRGEKFTFVAIPDAWYGRLGKYRAINIPQNDCMNYLKEQFRPDETYVWLAVRHGVLVLMLDKESRPMVLTPINDQLAVFAGVGQNLGAAVPVTIVDGRDQVTVRDVDYIKMIDIGFTRAHFNVHSPAAGDDLFTITWGGWPVNVHPERVDMTIDYFNCTFTNFQMKGNYWTSTVKFGDLEYSFGVNAWLKQWNFSAKHADLFDLMNLAIPETHIRIRVNSGLSYGNDIQASRRTNWAFSEEGGEVIPGSDFAVTVGSIRGVQNGQGRGGASYFNIGWGTADAIEALSEQLAVVTTVYMEIGETQFSVPLYRAQYGNMESYLFQTPSYLRNTNPNMKMRLWKTPKMEDYNWYMNCRNCNLLNIGGPTLDIVMRIGEYQGGFIAPTRMRVDGIY